MFSKAIKQKNSSLKLGKNDMKKTILRLSQMELEINKEGFKYTTARDVSPCIYRFNNRYVTSKKRSWVN